MATPSSLNHTLFKTMVKEIFKEETDMARESRTTDRPDYLDLPSSGEPWPLYDDYKDINMPFNGNISTYDTPNSNKDLILLTVNVGVGNSSREKVNRQMNDISGYIKQILDDINKTTKYCIKAFIISSNTNETKIECIFPKAIDVANILDINSINDIINNKDGITL